MHKKISFIAHSTGNFAKRTLLKPNHPSCISFNQRQIRLPSPRVTVEAYISHSLR